MKKIIIIIGLLMFGGTSFGQSSDSVENDETVYATMPADSLNYIVRKVDPLPEFPGGKDRMLQYLMASVRYPKEAREKDIQGKVVITFIVDKEGVLVDPRVTRSVGGGIDEEAMRVVKGMPQWKPGLIDGKRVKVLYHLPISFKLAK